MDNETQFKCTVCGQIGTVGRCCGHDTREPINAAAVAEVKRDNERKAMHQDVNPCYVAYAKAHGMTPARMMARDRRKYPGGCMCGFICWMHEQQKLFYQRFPDCCFGPDRILDIPTWVAFLQTQADAAAAARPAIPALEQ